MKILTVVITCMFVVSCASLYKADPTDAEWGQIARETGKIVNSN
jgi:hypothetical protein